MTLAIGRHWSEDKYLPRSAGNGSGGVRATSRVGDVASASGLGRNTWSNVNRAGRNDGCAGVSRRTSGRNAGAGNGALNTRAGGGRGSAGGRGSTVAGSTGRSAGARDTTLNTRAGGGAGSTSGSTGGLGGGDRADGGGDGDGLGNNALGARGDEGGVDGRGAVDRGANGARGGGGSALNVGGGGDGGNRGADSGGGGGRGRAVGDLGAAGGDSDLLGLVDGLVGVGGSQGSGAEDSSNGEGLHFDGGSCSGKKRVEGGLKASGSWKRECVLERMDDRSQE